MFSQENPRDEIAEGKSEAALKKEKEDEVDGHGGN